MRVDFVFRRTNPRVVATAASRLVHAPKTFQLPKGNTRSHGQAMIYDHGACFRKKLGNVWFIYVWSAI